MTENSPSPSRRTFFSMRSERYLSGIEIESAPKPATEEVRSSLIFDIEEAGISAKHFLTRTAIGIAYQNVMLVISVLSCFQYIGTTYVVKKATLDALNKVELTIAAIFLFDWCLSLFVADNKRFFLTSFFSMVDLLTVIPIFVLYDIVCPDYNRINSGKEAVIYILYGFSTTRILRALRVWRKLSAIEDPVSRAVGQMATTISIMILFSKYSVLYCTFNLSLTVAYKHMHFYYSKFIICFRGFCSR